MPAQTTLTIGEVAERSGFPPSTLRYDEAIGLVVPSARSGAGYRLYDERALARLSFVGRAKRLGCTPQRRSWRGTADDGEPCDGSCTCMTAAAPTARPARRVRQSA